MLVLHQLNRMLAIAIAGLLCSGQASSHLLKPSKDMAAAQSEIILLGTGGGPIPRIARSQPSTLIRIGDRSYLVDIGDGTARQLAKAGIRLNAIDYIFITHLHFDHTSGIMGFVALDWQDRRRAPVTVIGPVGTNDLLKGTLLALSGGEAIFRPQLPDLGPIASIFAAREIDVVSTTEIYSDGTIKVSAVENSHYRTMPPAQDRPNRSYSYRFDLPDRSVVFTGDTGPSTALEVFAKGADTLVSEVIDIDALTLSLARRQAVTGVDQSPLLDHMRREHLTPENVGIMARNAGVTTLVLTHFATPPGIEAIDESEILAEIRKNFAGEVIFGTDLQAL